MTLIQVDEYGLALAFWAASALVLLAKALQWRGPMNHPVLTSVTRSLFVLAAIAFMPLSTVWTEVKRHDRPWSNLSLAQGYDTTRSLHHLFRQAEQPHEVALSWASSTTPNVSHYNIYRLSASAPLLTKVGSSAPDTTFVDTMVEEGKAYVYAATAVDSTGNESQYSEPVLAVIPKRHP